MSAKIDDLVRSVSQVGIVQPIYERLGAVMNRDPWRGALTVSVALRPADDPLQTMNRWLLESSISRRSRRGG